MTALASIFLLASALTAQDQQHTEFSRTRFEVIVPLLRQSRFADAEQLTRELLAKAEVQLVADSLEIGRILTLLADIRFREGNAGEPYTLGIIERAYRIKVKVLGEDHEETLSAASMYASALRMNANLAASSALYDQIAQAYARNGRKLNPPMLNGPMLNGLNSLSGSLLLGGQPERARGFAEQALAMAEKLTGTESAETAAALSTMGFIRQALGEHAAALSAFTRAMKLNEKALGPDHRLSIASYGNLATHLTTLGNFAEARRLHDRANIARERLLGPDHPDNAIGQHNLAMLLSKSGDSNGARVAFEKALALRLRTLGEVNALTGTTLAGLAETMYNLQDYRGALAYSDRAIAVLLITAGQHHPYYHNALTVRAFILERTAGVIPAFHQAVMAARLRNEHVRLSTQAMAERTALSYVVEPERNAADLTLSLALFDQSLGSAGVRDAWDLRIHSRAMVLDEMSARRRLAAYEPGADLAVLYRSLLDSRRTLAHLVLTAGSVDGSVAKISETIDRKEKIERELGSRNAALGRDFQRGDIGFSEVAARLPPGSALVSFVRFQKHPDRRSWIAAFVLRAGSEEPTLVSIGADSEIEHAVANWRASIAGVATDPSRAGKRTESLTRAAGEVLRRRVWDPLAPLLRGADLVFVVPDGALHLVNLIALPVGSDRYLVETGPTIHTIATERDLMPPLYPARVGTSLLALGNPAFDDASAAPTTPVKQLRAALRGATPACADLRRVHFAPLPASRTEANEIARLWTGGGKAVVLDGASANEAEFRARAPGQRIVHIATHGFFLGQQCGANGLIGDAAQQSPLVLSGLALAGANLREKASVDGEDGLLTAEEIAGLNLEGVEWVVLSGCDTGLGQIRGAEGVLGLRRAFQTAGAATVIVSLWPVEDSAARDWMRALYENRLKRGQTTAKALREASLMALHARRQSRKSTHPFFWAAFVGAGDWR